jgi:hypothetical protein
MLETFRSLLVLMDEGEKRQLMGLLEEELKTEEFSLDAALAAPPRLRRKVSGGPIWIKHVRALGNGERSGAYDIEGGWVSWRALEEWEGYFVACPRGPDKCYHVLSFAAGQAAHVSWPGGGVRVQEACLHFSSGDWEEVREMLRRFGV